MRIEQYEAQRELMETRLFNLFLAIVCIFCLIFLVWGWVSTMVTINELREMSREIMGRLG